MKGRLNSIILPNKDYISLCPLFLLTILLRLSYLGLPPYSDEGIYGALALERSLTFGLRVNAYPYFTALLLGDPSNPLIAFRLFDSLWAALAGMALFILLRKWFSPITAFIVACMWIIVTNCPSFCQGGFKNSILASTSLLLLGLCMINSGHLIGCFCSGLFICLAIFFREAFLFIPVTSILYAQLHNESKEVIYHFFGLLFGTIMILLFIGVHESIFEVTKRYLHLKNVIEYVNSFTSNAFAHWIRMLKLYLNKSSCFLLPSIFYFILRKTKYKKPKNHYLILFSILLFPFLPETLTYLGRTFSYHISQINLAFCILSGLGIEKLLQMPHTPKNYFIKTIAICSVLSLSIFVINDYVTHYKLGKKFAPITIEQNWNNEVVNQSTYLLLSKKILEFRKPNDVLAVSGTMLAVNLLTKTPMPGPRFVDISFLHCMEKLYPVKEVIRKSKTPSIVLESTRRQVDMTTIWPDFYEKYTLVYTLNRDKSRHYGSLGASIWRLKTTIDSEVNQD